MSKFMGSLKGIFFRLFPDLWVCFSEKFPDLWMVLSGSEWRNPEQWELKYPPPGHMNTRDGGNQSSDITVHVRSETSTI